MCLIVNKKIHTETMKYRNQDIPKPLIATEDIHCTKYLSTYNGRFFTPYMAREVIFDENLTAKMASNVKSKKLPFYVYKNAFFDSKKDFHVTKGIHSCANLECMPVGLPFEAIIPKGSMYYVGQNNDYVSSELIVFQDYESYYKKCIECSNHDS